MANSDHLGILNRGVLEWNSWRQRDGTRPDLTQADFRDKDLTGIDFRMANLTETDFCNTDLTDALLQGANLLRADFFHAKLIRANLSSASLLSAIFVETDLTDAILDGSAVYGAAVWKVKLSDQSGQHNLIVTPEGEPTITVDNLEIAQFIYLLLNNKKLRHVIDTITSKVVLILGRFTADRKALLDAIRDELRKHNYLPVLFDFDKPANLDLTETISLLAKMSRFIIVDLTDPRSVPHELATVVPELRSVPIRPIVLKSQTEYGMFRDFLTLRHVMKPFRYRNERHLLASLEQKVISPAEKLVERLARMRTRSQKA
jgi:hypothetical protein